MLCTTAINTSAMIRTKTSAGRTPLLQIHTNLALKIVRTNLKLLQSDWQPLGDGRSGVYLHLPALASCSISSVPSHCPSLIFLTTLLPSGLLPVPFYPLPSPSLSWYYCLRFMMSTDLHGIGNRSIV